MLDTFHWFRGEAFEFIIEDLCAMPRDIPIIAEGFRLLPRLVAPLIASRRHALWLLPTPAFRATAFDARGTTWDIPNRTSDPGRALRILLARDRMFTTRLEEETEVLNLTAVHVDEGSPLDDLEARAGAHPFG